MDKILTLPPLVRGNITGFLDFFIDEIRIFRNLLFLTEGFDIVAQVQWWGEISPAYIRPRKLELPRSQNKGRKFLKAYIHSARYVIKTKLDLFKSYLRTCEVIEVSVLEAVENYVIGSAFLKDLINLLNSKELVMPIFNYLGEEIGEVKIHVDFCQNVEENFSQRDRVSKSYHLSHESLSDGKDPSRNLNQTRGSCKCLPEIETIDDSSKVLYFDLGLKCRYDKKCLGQAKKFNTSSVKCKGKLKKTEKVKSDTSKVNPVMSQNSNKCSSTELKERHSNLQNVPSRESNETKVFDYLLGSEMSKEEEEKALNDFKRMSPSQNIITSINQLCLSSESPKSKSLPKGKQIQNLHFDFRNPIERDYYERFFTKSNGSDFEVAAFLNQPENNFLLEKWRERENEEKGKNVREEKDAVDVVNERFAKGCSRCKYYKKLDELDTIIESLKHFEKKILTDEKNAGESSRRLIQKTDSHVQ